MMRAGHYDSFNDRFDDWVDRWWRTPAFPDARPTRLDLATSNKVKYYAYSLPGVGAILKSGAQWNDLQDYMATNGLGWADIDPLRASDKFGNTPASTAGVALKLSKNVLKLYR